MAILTFIRSGRISRKTYFWIGTLLILLKQLLDRLIAAVWHQPWNIWSYWMPLGRLANFRALTVAERDFLLSLAAAAIPFVVVGVVLTMARLRTIHFPLWFVVLFFAPVLNLIFFLLLLGPDRPDSEHRPGTRRFIPESKIGSAIAAVLVTSAFTALFTVFSTRVLSTYGLGLFIALPFCLGLLSTLLYGYSRPRSLRECMAVATMATCIPGLVLLLSAIEGLGCLFMAAPLAIPIACVGGLVGWAIQSRPMHEVRASLLMVPLLFCPGFIGIEGWFKPQAPLFRVSSSIEIAAPPQAVWNQVVAFTEIPQPAEWLFRAGIAYPIRARIDGRGPGAVRKCEFSTGPFIEPIRIWDEPRLLRFGVTHNPPPMSEWSPYGALNTPHLNGFLASKQGQFLLTKLPNGHTLLEGTTWYTDSLWPAAYWREWSDYIIHRIHMRVLEHIRTVAEEG